MLSNMIKDAVKPPLIGQVPNPVAAPPPCPKLPGMFDAVFLSTPPQPDVTKLHKYIPLDASRCNQLFDSVRSGMRFINKSHLHRESHTCFTVRIPNKPVLCVIVSYDNIRLSYTRRNGNVRNDIFQTVSDAAANIAALAMYYALR